MKKNVITKTVHVGFAFLILFTAYNIAQGILTTIFQNIGFYSFALIYFPYALSSLISPWIGRKLGVRSSLLFGSITYVLWIMSLSFKNLEFMLVLSVLNGIGSGLLWVHEGIWLTHLIKSDENITEHTCTTNDIETCLDDPNEDSFQSAISENSSSIDNEFAQSLEDHNDLPSDSSNVDIPGRLDQRTETVETDIKKSEPNIKLDKKMRTGSITGIFFCIYNFNGIIGSGMVMILSYYLDIFNIVWVLSGIGALSWILFWLIPYPAPSGWKLLWNKLDTLVGSDPLETSNQLDISQISTIRSGRAHLAISQSDQGTIREHFKKLSKVWYLPGFILLPLLMIQCSMLIIFTYGTLPLLLQEDLSKITTDYTVGFLVSGLFLCYGIIATVFSFMWGKLYDRLGWKFVLGGYQTLVLLQFIHLFIRSLVYIQPPNWYIWWIVASIGGAIDTGAVGLLNIILTKHYSHKDSPYVFAWYRFVYCMGLAGFSLLNLVLPTIGLMSVILIWSLITTLSIILFYRKMSSIVE